VEHLTKIAEKLISQDLEAELFEPTESIPFPHLLVTLHSEVSETEVYTIILSIISGEVLAATFATTSEVDIVSILYSLPYEVNPESIPELVKLINLLNKVITLGAFGYDEQVNGCFYRYSLPLNSKDARYTEVGALFVLLQDILSTYVSIIDDVSMGVITTKDLLESFQRSPENQAE